MQELWFLHLKSLQFLFFNICFAKCKFQEVIKFYGARTVEVRRVSFETCNPDSNNHMKNNICTGLDNLKIVLTCMSAFNHSNSKRVSCGEAIIIPILYTRNHGSKYLSDLHIQSCKLKPDLDTWKFKFFSVHHNAQWPYFSQRQREKRGYLIHESSI